MPCDLPTAFLEAKFTGALTADVHWTAATLECDGMRRPGVRGFRLRLSGTVDERPLTLVFGTNDLAEGEDGVDVPVNLTIIAEGLGVYGTRGEGHCTFEAAEQTALPTDPATPDRHRWQLDAHGFCLDATHAIDASGDAILPVRFRLRGVYAWDPDPTTP